MLIKVNKKCHWKFRYIVQPLENGHPWGNVYWPLKRVCPFNRGKNNSIALIRTLITGLHNFSAFSNTQLPPELRRVLSCKSPAVFLHFPLEEKGLWGPFYQLWRVLAKGRHLLQILLKALIKGATVYR